MMRSEHQNLIDMRAKHPDWIWNRSDTHVFLGVPGAHDAFKTPVEPGNSFAPGPKSYGVSSWIFTENQLSAPETMPLNDLRWRFVDGYIPVLVSEWVAGRVQVTSRLFVDGDLDLNDFKNYLTLEVHNPSQESIKLSLFLVLRSFGAGGAPLKQLTFRDNVVFINNAPLVYPDTLPDAFGAVSYAETMQDISGFLKQGTLPTAQAVDDASTWASGALAYEIQLQPGETRRLEFAFHVHAGDPRLTWLTPPTLPLGLREREQAYIKSWREQSPIRLQLPDKRFSEAFFAQLTHTSIAMVMDSVRTTPVTYPLWWIRDGCYQVITLDRGGLQDAAARACRDAIRRDVLTGFGAEADAPGELIWMLSEHYLLTGSHSFLEEVYPFIAAKADLIIKMRHTRTPIKFYNEFITSEWGLEPHLEIMCAPARDGWVQGRMDHHYPLYWVNGFCYLGLVRAAQCAEELGLDGSRYRDEAEQLQAAMLAHAPALFGKNERDLVCAIWPTEWASADDALIRERFDLWWDTVRYPQGSHHPERLWTYFEIGTAHNYMRLGQRERTWVSLDYALDHHTAPGLYTWPEGEKDENSALLLWERTRGWDRVDFVTPAGWTGAEMFLLLRNCLAREDGDTLVLGEGIPKAWMDVSFQVHNLPTAFGKLSYRYHAPDRTVEVQIERTPKNWIRAAFPIPVDVQIAATAITT